MPAKKYPSVPFTLEEVRDLLQLVEEYFGSTTTTVRLAPTKTDPGRILVLVTAFRRSLRIGEKPRVSIERYLPGGRCNSLEATIHQLLWQLYQEGHGPSEDWGRFTSLIPSAPR